MSSIQGPLINHGFNDPTPSWLPSTPPLDTRNVYNYAEEWALEQNPNSQAAQALLHIVKGMYPCTPADEAVNMAAIGAWATLVEQQG
ncbi:MAG: hypothetical protein KBC64_00005, partial [Simkaniaceae bacterium]|nr:hypothetical protein [Simkaniaceae bacterium]